MPHLKINNISMYYEVHGKGEPIVFIGGFSSDLSIWRFIVAHFEKDFQVILFDNRGAGQTDAPAGAYSIKEMTDDVVCLCSKLGIDRAHFVAHSMGGFILQTLAFHYPSLVKSAIISNSTFAIHTNFHNYLAAQLELLKAGAPLKSIIKASCCWVFSYKFLSKPGVLDELIQLTLDTPYPFTIQGYEGQYAALVHFDSRNWVNQIKVPTLVLASDQDLVFRELLVKYLAEQIQGSDYYCFSDCSHIPQIEYPEKFYTIVRDFIS